MFVTVKSVILNQICDIADSYIEICVCVCVSVCVWGGGGGGGKRAME